MAGMLSANGVFLQTCVAADKKLLLFNRNQGDP
jgi:hypothetical protein